MKANFIKAERMALAVYISKMGIDLLANSKKIILMAK